MSFSLFQFYFPYSHPYSPHSHPESLHSYPHSPHSHTDSSHSHPYFLHSHPLFPHSPHSVPRFPIPAFTDSLLCFALFHVVFLHLAMFLFRIILLLHSSDIAVFSCCTVFMLHYFQRYNQDPRKELNGKLCNNNEAVKHCCKALHPRCLESPGYVSIISMFHFFHIEKYWVRLNFATTSQNISTTTHHHPPPANIYPPPSTTHL